MLSPTSLSTALIGALLAIVSNDSLFVSAQGDNPTFQLHRQCLCQPTQSCWPSAADWSALNTAVGGRLIPTKPAAYECHNPNYDPGKCQEIQKGYFFDSWRHLQPGAVEQTNWELFNNKGCRGFNQTEPCFQGAVPLYTINATSVQDVQQAVRFAAKKNIRLVVKNTGHDYHGRSIGVSSLNIWVHHLKSIAFNDSFVPEGAPKGTPATGAIILDPGVIWRDAYIAADKHNVTVVGAGHATVGTSGGFCQGGGHGPLSPRYGLCVDNVLQFKVVTADGKTRTANAYRNKDLFWALRGGGGSTFGVVVQAIYKTHPPLRNISYATYRIAFNGTESRRQVYSSFLSQQLSWSKAGHSGYALIQKEFLLLYYYLLNSDAAAGQKSFEPFLKDISAIPGVTVDGTVTGASSFWESFKAGMPPPEVPNSGTNVLLGSRLIPQSKFESEAGVKQLSDTFYDVMEDLDGYLMPQEGLIGTLVAGGQVSKGTSKETSVGPAWRQALFHIISPVTWDNSASPEAVQTLGRKVTSAIERLREITPGSGAYFNEADHSEPNWQQSFFGSNYPRLKQVKTKYDPYGVFICHHCVGSEDWNENLTCRHQK
ncbi:hypothetical protein BX616_009742 [Lobosporangium transversale]|uniref:FAD-binding PCMH-type domain-containing protein n=1 Tax=Lobosporangium transversale TaxID=64571 RepID=A0A1Y2GYQ4_9FUNG|nr:hypothetical protein BCR41DRAFT_411796 [Lobosporangium transversale]KAF9913686.1 hypothetical protein BX616_009742 [Lobosporangium transversale]ORZ27429.1 hypothetical protein BCR41DRAFT_411796 [Lobosporangium transversale]|eukprot:XP_021885156.1 hypothetical protein BCR41DRAFT_411796 [Lobosporangium transversale]